MLQKLALLALCLTTFLGLSLANFTFDDGTRKIYFQTSSPCIIRLLPAGQNSGIDLVPLLPRLGGLSPAEKSLGWHVLPQAGAKISVPKGSYRLEAVAGLETAMTRLDLDLNQPGSQNIKIELRPLFAKQELVPGNTHLHLKNMTRAESDDYLRQIPLADGLKVLFISYLERVPDDRAYITNQYPLGDLLRLADTGVLYNNGEEHRHNLLGFGEGYGHVMFLNIAKLVQPVSIGPGIMAKGFDDTPLSPGIQNARRQGGTVLWCHNTNGFEDVINVLQGHIDALNVFDGSRTGTFEDNYYKYLNVGIRLPISTGTDWFMYDFSRVYAKVLGKLTIHSWLEAVKAGRCQATNGPILSLEVDGQEMGATLDLQQPATVKITAAATGRHDFQKLQLIHNGKVIKMEPSQGKDIFTSNLRHSLRIDEPGWVAVRIESTTKNEFDKTLFAHSSPIYLDLAGKKIFQVDDALALAKQVEEGRQSIKTRGKFSSPAAAQKLLALYDNTIEDLHHRINRRK